MADPVIAADVVAGEPTEASNQNTQNEGIAANAANINLISTTVGPSNGSFEYDFDTDGEPDEWIVQDFNGGSHSLDTADNIHGAKGLKCNTTVGGGWVQADSNQFIEVAGDIDRVEFKADIKVITATQRVRYEVDWYADDQTTVVATDSIFDNSVAVGTTQIGDEYLAPSTARYYKQRLIAGEVGTVTAASVVFDGVSSRIYTGTVFSGTTNIGTVVGGTTIVTVTPVANEMPRRAYVHIPPVPSGNIETQSWDNSAQTWNPLITINLSGSAANGGTAGATGNLFLVKLDDAGRFRFSSFNGAANTQYTVVGYEV